MPSALLARLAALAGALALAAPATAAAAVAVYPSAGTPDASPSTQISFRGAPLAALTGASVAGSRSGAHPGTWTAHSDGQGASFFPSRPFRPDELVTVSVPATAAGPAATVRFRIAGVTPPFVEPTQRASHVHRRGEVQRFRSRPDLAPPAIAVTRSTAGAASGDLFVAPKLGDSQQGPMLLDPRGGLLWFQPMHGDDQAFDFRTQTFESRPVLTWWQGQIKGFHGLGEGEVLDTGYRRIARVRAGNGYQMDLHELTLTPRGTALIPVYQPVPWDLRPVGGPRHGLVYDGIVQEIDVRTGAVVFEWHSLSQVGLAESFFPLHVPGFATPVYDYFHLNSIELEPNGNLLVSARHTHALYEIDRDTGRVLWRMGGKRSSFRMGPGTTFAWQHDARRQPDGTISLFDNHQSRPVPRHSSRGLVLRVDERARTVSVVRSVRHQPGLLAPTQGSLQLLAGGDALVGWGGMNSAFSELDARGQLVFDAHFVARGDESYRAYRLAWSGTPGTAPAAVAQVSGARTIVWASWNGATEVAGWRVLAGDDRAALRPAAAAPRRAFETPIAVPGRPRVVAVQALDRAGRVLATSPPAAPAR